MRALILAAGKGERLRPHTESLAKPAIPFLNVPMLGYPLYYLERAGVTGAVVNTHHLPGTVLTCAKKIARRGFTVTESPEPDVILGSGGGLARASRHFSDQRDVFVVNADAVALFAQDDVLARALAAHQAEPETLATLICCPFPAATESFGGVYVQSLAGQIGQVRRFSKSALNDPELTPYHFTGYMVINQRVWQGLSETPSNLLYEILQPRIDRGEKVRAFVVPNCQWFETGNEADYLAATQMCLRTLATPGPEQRTLIRILDRYTPQWWKGWRVPVKSEGYLLSAVQWPERLQVTGFAVIGPEVWLGANVHLERTVIGGRTDVADSSHFHNQIILTTPPGSAGHRPGAMAGGPLGAQVISAKN